jgi:O-antigen/teichoic acid export membrane protein
VKLGALTWTQSTVAVIFTQLDRLVVGVVFGSVAAGAYTLCIQIAQPIAGTAASALHFIFPYLARTSPDDGLPAIRARVAKALICNLLLVGVEAGLLLGFGAQLLRLWAAPIASQIPRLVLPLAVLASAFVGLAVTGTYAMLAFGRAGTVLWTTLASGAAMLSSIHWLWHHFGTTGVAASRLLFGLASLGIYIALVRRLNKDAGVQLAARSLQLAEAREGS